MDGNTDRGASSPAKPACTLLSRRSQEAGPFSRVEPADEAYLDYTGTIVAHDSGYFTLVSHDQ